MSTYVRHKVLRVPMDKIDFSFVISKIKEKFPDKKIKYVLSYQLADLYDEWLASKE